MQRIEILIEKLKEQHNSNVAPHLMLATLQLIEAAIVGRLKETEVLGTSTITVLVPNAPTLQIKKLQASPNVPLLEKEVFELSGESELTASYKDEETEVHALPDFSIEKKATSPEKKRHNIFDIIEDIPTYFQQEKQTSLFDRDAKTAADKVKDLRKAIDKESRQLFIEELFRADENMYERSIKTINSFHIYAEAEYWIKRELRTKIGWPVDSEAVNLFDAIVKRRFG